MGYEAIEPVLLHARAILKVGVAGLEPATPCSQGRRACHCATPRNWLWRQDSNLQLTLVNSQALCRLSYARISMSLKSCAKRSEDLIGPPEGGTTNGTALPIRILVPGLAPCGKRQPTARRGLGLS